MSTQFLTRRQNNEIDFNVNVKINLQNAQNKKFISNDFRLNQRLSVIDTYTIGDAY